MLSLLVPNPLCKLIAEAKRTTETGALGSTPGMLCSRLSGRATSVGAPDVVSHRTGLLTSSETERASVVKLSLGDISFTSPALGSAVTARASWKMEAAICLLDFSLTSSAPSRLVSLSLSMREDTKFVTL